MESTFDVNSIQNAQFTDANSTVYTPIPEGEFKAIIDKQAIRQAKESIILDITWKIDDATVTAETGIDNPSCRQSLFLDINEGGTIDFSKGKNINLGRLREALGQNKSGQAWQFGMLVGQIAKVKTKQRKDGENIYTDVVAVTKLS
jgi:hypothetical protein